jgi:antitoxin ParD1/3/4
MELLNLKVDRMGMNVNLTPHLEEMVRNKVSSGKYTSASEVVREALRLMQEQDQLKELKLQQLRNDIQQGLNSGPGVPWDAEEMKLKFRQAFVAKKTKKEAA